MMVRAQLISERQLNPTPSHKMTPRDHMSVRSLYGCPSHSSGLCFVNRQGPEAIPNQIERRAVKRFHKFVGTDLAADSKIAKLGRDLTAAAERP